MGTAPVSSWARDTKGTSPSLRFLIARVRLEDEDSGGDTASPAGHVAGPCSSPAKHFALHKTGPAALQPAAGLSQQGEVGTRQPPWDTRVTETPRQESQEAACGQPALGRGTKNGVTCDGHGAGGSARAPTFTPALLGWIHGDPGCHQHGDLPVVLLLHPRCSLDALCQGSPSSWAQCGGTVQCPAGSCTPMDGHTATIPSLSPTRDPGGLPSQPPAPPAPCVRPQNRAAGCAPGNSEPSGA